MSDQNYFEDLADEFKREFGPDDDADPAGRAALAGPEPCTYCHGEGSITREFYGGAGGFKTMTCPACGGTGNHADEIERRARMARNEPVFADSAPEPPACPNCDAERVMADGDGWRCPFCGWRSEPSPAPEPCAEMCLFCGENPQVYNGLCDACAREEYGTRGLAAPEPPSPALVNEDGRGEYPVAEMWRGYAQAAREEADAAEWAVGELRAALEGLLESGCTDYVNPRTDDVSCAVCGAVSRHPMRHAAGCPVQAAEDALKDTADVARKLAAATEAHRALVEAAQAVRRYATLTDDPEVREIEQIWLDDLAAALAALEGEAE